MKEFVIPKSDVYCNYMLDKSLNISLVAEQNAIQIIHSILSIYNNRKSLDNAFINSQYEITCDGIKSLEKIIERIDDKTKTIFEGYDSRIYNDTITNELMEKWQELYNSLCRLKKIHKSLQQFVDITYNNLD